MVSFACRNLLGSLHDAEGPIRIRGGNAVVPEYEAAEGFVMSPYSVGWARRPRHGAMYGKSYIDRYRKDIILLFSLGAENASEKMHASWIFERLQELHPKAFDLPSEQDIRTEYQRHFNLQKAGKSLNTPPGHGGSKNPWIRKLEEYLQMNMGASSKAKQLLIAFKAHVAPVMTDDALQQTPFPTDAQLTSKIYAVKRKMYSR